MSHPLFNLFFDDGGQQLYEDKNRVPPFGHETVFLFLNLKILYLLILEREKGRERKERRKRNISLLYHLLIHSLVDSCMWPDWGSNQQLWHMGQHSNQLSYPARAKTVFTYNTTVHCQCPPWVVLMPGVARSLPPSHSPCCCWTNAPTIALWRLPFLKHFHDPRVCWMEYKF